MQDLRPKCRDGTGKPCSALAEVRLKSDGEFVPGCFMCRAHAEECLREYLAKLEEDWSMVDLLTGEETLASSLPTMPAPKPPKEPLADLITRLLN